MAIVCYLPSNQITQISGYNYIAELQFGSDGQMYGPPELDAGTAGSRATGNVVWDGYPDDGIDTGWLGASYELQAGTNGLTWQAGGLLTPITYPVGTLSGVSSISIRAGVQNQAAMQWRNVHLSFYRGSTLQETVDLNSFGVDLTDSGGVAQELVTIQPARTDNNHVSITGEFKMVAPAGVYLDSYDTLTQILSYSGGRSSSNFSTSGTSSDSLLAQPTASLRDWKPYVGTETSASSPFSDELLAVDQTPDLLQSPDPGLL